MGDHNGKCDDCGRFVSVREGGRASWADQYDMVAMCCDYVHLRCARCTDLMGPVTSNARPVNKDMSPYQGIF